jgi:rare lipoprotein A
MTANGEVFDPDGLNAAHKYLPLPIHVRVTNLQNRRSIILRVNDRGPFVDGRIIDLSAGAAKRLGFYEKGTATVLVETILYEPMS